MEAHLHVGPFRLGDGRIKLIPGVDLLVEVLRDTSQPLGQNVQVVLDLELLLRTETQGEMSDA